MAQEKTTEDKAQVARRDFLLGAGTAGAAGLGPAVAADAQHAAPPSSASPAAASTKEPDQFVTLTAQEADRRIATRSIRDLQYYNGDVHRASFALPNFVRELVGQSAA